MPRSTGSSRSRHHHRGIIVKALALPPFVRYGLSLAVAVSLLILLSVWIWTPSSSSSSSTANNNDGISRGGHRPHHHQEQPQDDSHRFIGRLRSLGSHGGRRGGGASSSSDRHRLAIIIPFIGNDPNAIPSYLELFCTAAAGSASLVDFLLIHDGVLDDFQNQPSTTPETETDVEKQPGWRKEDEVEGNVISDEESQKLKQQQEEDNVPSTSMLSSICPSNVLFLSLKNTETFARALVRVLDRKPEDEFAPIGPKRPTRSDMARLLAKHILKYPYVLVEFKPALGHIFESFLDGYTHWGYSDLDILFGDLEKWITHDELNDFDIVTYGFGDQDRLYLRGQFTFHRNDPTKINQLWRRCAYLSDMDERFANVLEGKSKLRFESAEGCYSAAVLEQTDITVKYAVKAFTDVDETDTAHSHGLYVGTGKKKDKTVLYKAGKDNPKGLEMTADDWFESKGSIYTNSKTELYRDVGDRERIPAVEKHDVKCMFWAQKEYQSRLCVDGVSSTDTVYWIDGQLFKQKYELASLPNGIVSAPFFHFQEWKRYYRTGQLGGFQRFGPASTFVLSKEGVLPILPVKQRRTGFLSLSRNDGGTKFVSSPLGLKLSDWHGLHNEDRSQLPRQHYCLKSVPRKRAPFTAECKYETSWHDEEKVEILSNAPGWSKVDTELEVTMVLTLQVHPEQVDDSNSIQGLINLLTTYLDRWQGQPSVLVMHVAGASPHIASLLRNKFSAGSDISYYSLDSCLVGAIFSTQTETMSRKALLNMATDVAPTRWVLNGYELERGVVMSHDTAYLAHRTAYIQKAMPGSVHIVPQFGLVDGEHDFTIPSLERAQSHGKIRSLAKLEEGLCDGDDASLPNEERGVFGVVEETWWRATRKLTSDGIPQQNNENSKMKEAGSLESLQNLVIALLTEDEHYGLYTSDVSPILLVDNMGPRPGMLASQMVREVEEFGGRLCYNSIRLAQMATVGFYLNVLAGAFAISTPATRRVVGDQESSASGASRCDGCFFFSEEQNDEEILETLSLDERKRPAKIAILWEQSGNQITS